MRVPSLSVLQVANLAAALLPGVLFGAGLWLLRGDPRFAFLRGEVPIPWQLVLIAVAGTLATAAGVADWTYHLRGHRKIGRSERRAEFLALVFGGLPLFALMAAATLARDPRAFLLPVVIVVIATVVGICYDEFTFHRRCARIEAAFHRTLTLGMGTAWLGWAHWCFVRGPVVA